MDAARAVVGDSLHHGHPERLLPPQQSAVDAEEEGGHEDLGIPESFSEGHIEGWRHDGIGVDEQEEVSGCDASPGVQSWPTPTHRHSRPWRVHVRMRATETEEDEALIRLLVEQHLACFNNAWVSCSSHFTSAPPIMRPKVDFRSTMHTYLVGAFHV